MSAQEQVVIVGGGHNGLVVASLLARAGLRPLVVERREVLGGRAVTEEIHPGFRCPTLLHTAGPFSPELISSLGLAAHGLTAIESEVRLHALSLTGPAITIFQDPARTAHELARDFPNDGARYPAFAETFAKIGRMLRPVLAMTPPAIATPRLPEAWQLLRLGKSFRDLGKKDAYRLLRWGPMAVADLAAEWFATDLLRAVVAARGIHCAFAGPWSAGSSLGVLLQAAHDGNAIAPAATYRGGPGALSEALASAARAAGATIRTGAEVAHIRVQDGKAGAVVLASGEEIAARAVISGADPRSTFLGLIDPVDLEPDFVQMVRNYRSIGTAAKVNYALTGLPAFSGGNGATLAGRIHIGPGIDSLERAFDAAKYGEVSAEPYLDITIPSLADPTLAPAGAHVMSVHAQFVGPRKGAAPASGEAVAATVEEVLTAYAPNFKALVAARRVLTPTDLERSYGLAGGHLTHGEQTLDQLLTMRPILGWAQYRTPIPGLYLCGSGTHPGGGITGLPGRNAAREILKDLK